ncbi:MAG: acyl carrier protein [Leptolyngbyaceae cyanobacterium CSU_1_3]|nr:acyl carrier protein [Leptolyngbyaceae cyanobacterium CSU_1_3]
MVQKISDDTVNQMQTADHIQSWMVAQIAEQIGVQPDEVDPTVTFESYGLDSAQAMSIASKTEALLGNTLSPVLLWHYPTIASLSQRLAEDLAASKADFFEI